MLEIRETIYKYSKENPPVAKAKPGDTVKFILCDCYDGQVQTQDDIAETVDWQHTNPATGPLYIEGAEPGDVLGVDILQVDVANQGAVCSIPECGPFCEESELRTHIFRIENDRVYWDAHDMVWPLNPMIGVIGCAPGEGEISTGFVGNHGGNMDSQIITKGVTVWIPVRVAGALLAMGDLHATMADGEVCGNGIEIAGEVTVRLRLVKNFALNWVVTETKDAYFVNTCGPTCDDAIREGYLELHRLIANAYEMDYTDTGMYMSIQGYLCANQACLVDEAGGDSFRVGTPKVLNKKPLIG